MQKIVVLYWHKLILMTNVYLGCVNDSQQYTEFHKSFTSLWKMVDFVRMTESVPILQKTSRPRDGEIIWCISAMQSASACCFLLC